jgi:hypothetical protein
MVENLMFPIQIVISDDFRGYAGMPDFWTKPRIAYPEGFFQVSKVAVNLCLAKVVLARMNIHKDCSVLNNMHQH